MEQKKIKDLSQKDLAKLQRGAQNWYASKLKLASGKTTKDSKIDSEDMFKGRRNVGKPEPGQMMFFKYFAKHDKKLPFWDQYPLAFIIDVADDSFLSLNLHYLPYEFREVIIDYLLKTITDTRLDHKSKARFSYGILKTASKYAIAQPALKRHLFSQIRSKVIRINPNEWPEAIYLPIQQWVRASNAKVFADTRRKVRG